jgi:hypothetical protein
MILRRTEAGVAKADNVEVEVEGGGRQAGRRAELLGDHSYGFGSTDRRP